MPTRAQQAVPLQRHIRQSEKTFGNQYNILCKSRFATFTVRMSFMFKI